MKSVLKNLGLLLMVSFSGNLVMGHGKSGEELLSQMIINSKCDCLIMYELMNHVTVSSQRTNVFGETTPSNNKKS